MSQAAVDGAIIGDYRDRGDIIDLTVMSRGRYERTTDALAHVPMAARQVTPAGTRTTVVPLSAVANLVHTSAPQQINRLEREPSITLSVQLPPNMTIDEANGIINGRILGPMREGGALPPDVRVKLTGSADKLDEFMGTFASGFLLAAVITYLLLAALFESFLHPFVIIMSVPFALVGGFLGLRILHTFEPTVLLDVLTMLGFVILIGTIVNNPILIVHQALNYIRDEGMDRRRAIALSTQTRVRPIFMSVITSVAGMAPLVVVGGAGSELYRGLGAVVVGGLLVSTFFTLFLTPALMSLMLDAQEGVLKLLGRGGTGGGRRDSVPVGPVELVPKGEDAATVQADR
jgi:HAE1 family hydrophobic/amphiphilic exporter-1